jgi:hypothetical protein
VLPSSLIVYLTLPNSFHPGWSSLPKSDSDDAEVVLAQWIFPVSRNVDAFRVLEYINVEHIINPIEVSID